MPFFLFESRVARAALIFLTFAAIFCTLSPFSAHAAGVPSILSYQGRLTDASGNLLGGTGTTYYFKFSLWSSASGGSQVWPVSPTSYGTTVRHGVFNVNIGDVANGYPDTLDYDFSSSNIYLQVEVSSNGTSFETLSPRQQVTSAAFAQVAGSVNGSGRSSIGQASTTVTSVLNGLFSGRTATTTILGDNATSTFSGAIDVTRGLNVNSYLFGAGLAACAGSGDKLIWDNGRFSCGVDAGGTGSGITALHGQYSPAQLGATQTFATSSDANIQLTITSAGDIHTFTPIWTGTLAAGRGGTGINNPAAAGILLGSYAGGGYQQIATSSLGLITTDVAE
ncbi:MAG: hypothetical protein V4481_04115, partial [Patescibacteria group bacterium]